MANVYEECPVLENERWRLRLVEKSDAENLLNVYSDKNALPFFNSDNCDGDNFYYPTKEQMDKAIDFWLYSYREKWFVRWVIIDKTVSKAIGTVELFHRPDNGDFGEVGVLRLDVGSAYEKSDLLNSMFALILPPAYELFDCDRIISKIPVYAVERIDAAEKYGFTKSEQYLIGKGDYAYNDYWIVSRS
ncbi:MAG: GNAT family N-acetyltransferase [Lachnospiraceae bacterium]|nr:GNAT family N-acetyltransferase [Lachnospiraceae bacterium]MBR3735758.1 GNAT family N-acetyltransferase [Lachnospiraceae bacterium]MBR6852128.1 GNAT family N-acetyltransferase [Lachnospiraceae bacterium]